MASRSLIACAAFVLASSGVAGAAPISGTFALAGTRTTTATLTARPSARDPLAERLTIVFRTVARGTPVRRFDLDMTKVLHLVIVRDDFRWFAHLHPALHPDGRFTLDTRFPGPGLYHLYAEVSPHGLGHEVERFDLAVDGGVPARVRDLMPTGTRVRVGSYSVVLDRVRLRAGREDRIVVHIRRGDGPASDLRPYLGARAHAVLIDAATLGYAHVHPEALGSADTSDMASSGAMMTMPTLTDDAKVAPDMVLHVTPQRAGAYKLWLQFRADTQVYVAPFVLEAD